MGTLYVVGTPIGNLEDITLRALRVLGEVDLIAAEDTRETRKLLTRYKIDKPLTSYFEHNKIAKLDELLDKLRTRDVALVSDAGMPGISDPGYELISAAIDAEIPVVPIPGPSAVTTALAISGLPTDQFLYLGFLPRRSADRRKALAGVADQRRTLVLYESPHRLADTLEDIDEVLGERPIAVASELTKMFERVSRGTPAEILEELETAPARGEYVIVIGGASKREPAEDEDVERELIRLSHAGDAPKELAAKVAARTDRSRRDVYRILLALRESGKI
jgi:16S rRNA (cytidine1402-2'-O)-methyltransferase